MKTIELLAPAGNMEKLKTAVHFGCDAVYLAYKKFGLRAYADNFDETELRAAVAYCHERGKKVYVTLNIFAKNADFGTMSDIILLLRDAQADGVIVSDVGVMCMVKKYAPGLAIHLSTQANLTNKYAARFYCDMGVKRLVISRELSLDEIKEIRDFIPDDVEIEAFVHGAMCISYSGRCLLSDYMTGRHSNSGECVQSCRWKYALMEESREGEYFPIEEDARGSYILNSKDLNMIRHIDKLAAAGINSFKIEGRVKTSYYVASVVGAYRRAIDLYYANPDDFSLPREISDDIEKPSHRRYCTGFYFGRDPDAQCYDTSKPKQTYEFTALVTGSFDGGAVVEMRNRFKSGDELEVMSPGINHNCLLKVAKMTDEDGNAVEDAMKVQQKIYLYTSLKLLPGDMLRKKAD